MIAGFNMIYIKKQKDEQTWYDKTKRIIKKNKNLTTKQKTRAYEALDFAIETGWSLGKCARVLERENDDIGQFSLL